MVDYLNRFDAIYNQAIEQISYLQPWSGHFLVRKTETEILASKFKFSKDHIGLELGCGNAFQSALLASVSKKIFATDLFKKNGATHSLGINKAQASIAKLDVKNIELVSCSGVSLPFADNYFDFVFSSSVLEHIEDRRSALLEMKRVLKPNGYLILIVPTHVASIYAFPHVFLYLLTRGIKLMFSLDKKQNKTVNMNRDDNTNDTFFNRFRKNHPSFPLPEPHGSYKNIFKELIEQIPSHWNRLIEDGGFKVVNCFSTCLIPWLLIEPFSSKSAANFYASSKGFHGKFCGLKFIKSCGYLMCFNAIKQS